MKGRSSWECAEIYIAGEIHGVKENALVKMALIEDLSKNYGVRRIALELGFFDSLGINEYLKRGDEKILKSVLDNYPHTYASAQSEVAFWRNLFSYNQSLEESRKLSVVGVDCNGKIDSVYKYILHYLIKSRPFDEGDNDILIEQIKTYKKKNQTHEIDSALSIEGKIRGLIEKYADRKKETITTFIKLIDELFAHGHMLLFPDKRKEIREEFIFKSLLGEYEKTHLEGKIFGQFGRLHVKALEKESSAVERIGQVLHNKCIRILYSYNNCTYFLIQDGKKLYRHIDEGLTENVDDVEIIFIGKEYVAVKDESPYCYHIPIVGTI